MKERELGAGPKGGYLTKDWRETGNKQIQKNGSKGNKYRCTGPEAGECSASLRDSREAT